MKKYLFLFAFIANYFIAFSQLSITNQVVQVGSKGHLMLTFGKNDSSIIYGHWGIEHWEHGFNICKPWPSYNWGNYKLFISDSTGNVGIGKRPFYKLDVDGDIATYGTLRITSDQRLKSDINPLSSSMDELMKLNPISFKYIQKTTNKMTDSNVVKDKTINSAPLQASANVYYGFNAQEIQKIFPQLVATDNSGYLTIDYIGFIPLMIQAMKELENKTEEISTLKNDIQQLKSQVELLSINNASEIKKDALSQNFPNPVNNITTINCNINTNFKKAFLVFYNSTGKEIYRYKIKNNNESVSISKNIFDSGTYSYSLIVDDKVMDTKTLISY